MIKAKHLLNPLFMVFLSVGLSFALTGTGTSVDPYMISTYEDLKLVENNLSAHYRLANSIDASASKTENGGLGWQPIGVSPDHFTGSFHGGGYRIYGLYSNRITQSQIGLFRVLVSGTVDSLGVDVDFTGERNVGGIAGNLTTSASISHSYSMGKVYANLSYAGGIAGYLGGTLSECYSSVRVFSHSYAGGLVGRSYKGTINNSYNTGRVIARYYAGGIAGQFSISTLTNSYNAGKVEATNTTKSIGHQSTGTITSTYYHEDRTFVSTNEATKLSDSAMAVQASFVGWDFSTIWEMPAGSPMPVLRGVNNAPFANWDNAAAIANINDLSSYLTNDFDDTLSTIASNGVARYASYSELNSTEDSLGVFYEAGEVLSAGDTLWGGAGIIWVPFNSAIAISDYNDLKKIGIEWDYPLDADYSLTAAIDARASQSENGGNGFLPIAFSNGIFKGKIHGNGHIITGLYIHRPDYNNIGLISLATVGAEVDSLGIQGDVTGNTYVGVLGGSFGGDLNQVYSSGKAEGTTFVGGLVGFLGKEGQNLYSVAEVKAFESAGGLLGYLDDYLENSYALSLVRAKSSLGGLVGGHSATESNTFWSSSYSGLDTSVIGTNLDYSLMTDSSQFLSWDFDTLWTTGINTHFPALKGVNNPPFGIVDVAASLTEATDFSQFLANDVDAEGTTPTVARKLDISRVNQTKDSLYAFYKPGEILASGDTLWGAAAYVATPIANPIVISSYEELKKIGEHWLYPLNAAYRLGQDIDASASQSENGGKGFDPIGSEIDWFAGSINGAGFEISNLYIQDSTAINNALISYLDSNARIDSLLLSGEILGGDSTAGLVAINYGTIHASTNKANIQGKKYLGGLVGYNYGVITSSINEGNVSGERNVGGLVGYNKKDVSHSSNHGTVIGTSSSVGGVVGQSSSTSTVSNLSNMGSVTGTDYTGGIVGQDYHIGTADSLYNWGSVTGTDDVGGISGYTESGYTQCENHGVVTGEDYVGGLFGEVYEEITYSKNFGKVNGKEDVGGIAGYLESNISYSYNVADITGSEDNIGGIGGEVYGVVQYVYNTGNISSDTAKTAFVGGLVSKQVGVLHDAYSIGDVLGSDSASGLVGKFSKKMSNTYFVGRSSHPNALYRTAVDSPLVSSYWNSDYLAIASAPYGAPLTSAAMMDSVKFISWDWATHWEIKDGASFPGLKAVNDAPFALRDTLRFFNKIKLDSVLYNDFDVDTNTGKLKVKVENLYGKVFVEGDSLLVFPDSALGYVDSIEYRVGEVLNDSVTLWGNRTVAALVKENHSPVLTAVDSQSINEDTGLKILSSMLALQDNDLPYQTITINVEDGSNYTVNGDSITVAANFHGELVVPVSVFDGYETTDTLSMIINVVSVNDLPLLTAVSSQSIDEDTALKLSLSMVTATDLETDDNSLILKSIAGTNYSISGDSIIPTANFHGELVVPVYVSDGLDNSFDTLTMTITVNPINDAPTIESTEAISIEANEKQIVLLSHLTTNDIDGDALTVIVQDGVSYSHSGNEITPTVDFDGVLKIAVVVSDGKLLSDTAWVNITVAKVETEIVALENSISFDGATEIVSDGFWFQGNKNQPYFITSLKGQLVHESETFSEERQHYPWPTALQPGRYILKVEGSSSKGFTKF